MLTHYLATTLYSSSVTPPPPTPIGDGLTLALVKQHLEYEDADRDALIQQYMNAATSWVENYTGKKLSVGAVTQSLDSFDAYILLNRAPFVSLTSIGYVAPDGTEATITGARLRNGRIYPPASGWPSVGDYTGVTVAYQAGYATVPADLISAQLLLIGDMFAGREASEWKSIDAVYALCRPHRDTLV